MRGNLAIESSVKYKQILNAVIREQMVKREKIKGIIN